MKGPGRPKEPNRVRINWRIGKDTKMKIQAQVVPGTKLGSPGKVIDHAFKRRKNR